MLQISPLCLCQKVLVLQPSKRFERIEKMINLNHRTETHSVDMYSFLLGYCWWTKSCTTKDDDYPIIYRVLTIPGGAGFCPSTVSLFDSNKWEVILKRQSPSLQELQMKIWVFLRTWKVTKFTKKFIPPWNNIPLWLEYTPIVKIVKISKGGYKNSIRIPSRISWGSFPRFTPLMPTSLMPTFRQSLMAVSQTQVYKGFFIFKDEATVKMYRDLYKCKGIKNNPPDVFPRVCFHYFSSTHLEWVHLFLWFLQCFSCSMYCFGVWNVVIYNGNQI